MELTDRELYRIKRKRKRITLKEAAQALGVDLSYLGKWEAGTYPSETNHLIEKYKKYIDKY